MNCFRSDDTAGDVNLRKCYRDISAVKVSSFFTSSLAAAMWSLYTWRLQCFLSAAARQTAFEGFQLASINENETRKYHELCMYKTIATVSVELYIWILRHHLRVLMLLYKESVCKKHILTYVLMPQTKRKWYKFSTRQELHVKHHKEVTFNRKNRHKCFLEYDDDIGSVQSSIDNNSFLSCWIMPSVPLPPVLFLHSTFVNCFGAYILLSSSEALFVWHLK